MHEMIVPGHKCHFLFDQDLGVQEESQTAIMSIRNNSEEQKENMQSKQQSDKRKPSPGQKYNLRKDLRHDHPSYHEDKGARLYYCYLIIKIVLIFVFLVS